MNGPLVSSEPFLAWLKHVDRSGWGSKLSDSQLRYVERLLKNRPVKINVYSVDVVLVALEQPHLLALMYPINET